MKRTQAELDMRWDIHSERQISASKAGAAAVTVLNSGSWLALLSQVGSLQDISIGWVLCVWGFGALFGTLIWLVLYLSTTVQMWHDFDRQNEKIIKMLNWNQILGIGLSVTSFVCFGFGVILLSLAFV